jgi:dimeric dUTPase (all-alpha-NTP-PPase superfamily)
MCIGNKQQSLLLWKDVRRREMNVVHQEQSRHVVSEFSITAVFSEGLIPRVQHRTQVTYIFVYKFWGATEILQTEHTSTFRHLKVKLKL